MNAYSTLIFEFSIQCWLTIYSLILLIIFFALYRYDVRLKRKTETLPGGRKQPQAIGPNWHTLSIGDIYSKVNSKPDGLTAEQAKLRLKRYGPNTLPKAKPKSLLFRFFSQFHNILIYVLLAASAVTGFLEHWLDTGVIIGVVIINALIGFIQEGKAENAMRGIRKMLSPKAMCLRDQQRVTLPAEQLVPGDIVMLQSGDKVPADLRIIEAKGLQIQESALTGESVAVGKIPQTLDQDTILADRINMAYSGTLVTHGQGAGVVIATGSKTEIGYISTLVASVDELTTPLLRQVAHFGRWLTAAILFIAICTFSFGIWIHAYAATEMFMAAVGLAVAAIPEGLPAIMTITLAIGVQRMAKRKAIIRRLPAVETLGAVSVICTDKTGTLTENEMTVSAIATGQHFFNVSGAGYQLQGDFVENGNKTNPAVYPVLNQMLLAGSLCNDTSLQQQGEYWQVHGDPMEGALLISAGKAGIDWEAEQQQYPRTDLIPFESELQLMATLHKDPKGNSIIFLKGAPERIMALCQLQRHHNQDQPLQTEHWQNCIDAMAIQGQRVLAIACKIVPDGHQKLTLDDIQQQCVLLGLFGLIDPPREEAIDAVDLCQAAGIRVKMITGDHGATALAIAKQLNFANTEKLLLGQQLATMSAEQLQQQIADTDVFARVSPEHKLLLVELLQQKGAIVAMTGDGVNDAPALKRADVGMAMGMKGTEAAKEAAEMVLADDNFASIVHAVVEGRTVYDNLKKAILFILPSSGGEALIIICAILFGFHQLPLTPVQILWVNMITTVTLALVLAFEPPEADIMQRNPRPPSEPMLSGILVWRIIFVSLILMFGTFGLFLWEMENGMSIEHARTVAVNTLVLFEIFYLFNSRYLIAPVLNFKGLFGNRYILVAIFILIFFQFAFTYLHFMQVLFETTAIDLSVWTRILAVASSVLFLVEIEKAVFRWMHKQTVMPQSKKL